MTFYIFMDGLEVSDLWLSALPPSLLADWRLLSNDYNGSFIFGSGFALSILLVLRIESLNLSSLVLSLQQFIFGLRSYYGSGVIAASLVVTTAPFGNVFAISASLLSSSGFSILTKHGYLNYATIFGLYLPTSYPYGACPQNLYCSQSFSALSLGIV